MELPPFDPIDFKKFTDGKTIVKVSKPDRTLTYVNWLIFGPRSLSL